MNCGGKSCINKNCKKTVRIGIPGKFKVPEDSVKIPLSFKKFK